MQFQKYFNEKITNIVDLNHKGNNQLFQVSTASGRFILKKYSKVHMDNWKRGETEFNALNYLGKIGFREIPKAVKFYEQQNIGIYSYEKGRILKSSEIKGKEISDAVNFLVKLHNLGEKHKIRFLPACSACLNLQEYINVLDRRVNSLFDYASAEEISLNAKKFFNMKIIPKINELKKDFSQKTKNNNLEKELNIDEQVITPADFGFHNILYNKRAQKFIDFEYFGRDDPVRQILDFTYHIKSSEIKQNLKNLFLESYKEQRKVSKNFQKRLDLAKPLIAMTWALIPLNVFREDYIKTLDLQKTDTKKFLEQRLVNAKKMFDLNF